MLHSGGRQIKICRPARSALSLSWHRNPLIEQTVPEKDDPQRTIKVASIRNKKSANAFDAAAGSVLKLVWTSLSVTPMSAKTMSKSGSEVVLQFRSMTILPVVHVAYDGGDSGTRYVCPFTQIGLRCIIRSYILVDVKSWRTLYKVHRSWPKALDTGHREESLCEHFIVSDNSNRYNIMT